jgi:ribosome-associated protein
MTQPGAIKLDQFLKWVGAAETGGQAKVLVQSGHVRVNGETETRRGRQLAQGDTIQVEGQAEVHTFIEPGSHTVD